MANAKPIPVSMERRLESGLRETGENRVLNILGASSRAAAFSARRAGFIVHASDLFGDADLRDAACFHELKSGYPEGFLDVITEMPPWPFIYTGGLENHPMLVDRLARIRLLWGNSGDALTRARDPLLVAQVLRQAGAFPPEVLPWSEPPTNLEGWLVKPLRGAGGRGIQEAATSNINRSDRRNRDHYFQRVARGTSCSALFVAHPAACKLLGATRQLVGERWLHARPFAWCGNLGPLALSPNVATTLKACGEQATERLGLRGLFGIDFLLEGDCVRPVELNPRYTGSAEVLEIALGGSAIAEHASACGRESSSGFAPPSGSRWVGKVVVFAPRQIIVGHAIDSPGVMESPSHGVWAADIPKVGTRVERGHPLVTLLCLGHSEDECQRLLREFAAQSLSRIQEG